MGGFSFLVSLRLRRVMMAWAGSTTLSVSCMPERGMRASAFVYHQKKEGRMGEPFARLER